MVFDKAALLIHINRIRREIGHEEVRIEIKEIIYDIESNELWIITNDRPDKSAVIGKGGWVVGRLREELGIESIHVESYSDFIQKEYRMSLSLNKLNSFANENYSSSDNEGKEHLLDFSSFIALNNLIDILKIKMEKLYSFDFYKYFKELEEGPYSYFESENPTALVALSGGTDSSFSLILAKKLGFNPIAVTVDPGTIVLPKQFRYNIDKLVCELDVSHEYVQVDYSELIEESFSGRFHPCGRCSKIIEETVYGYAIEKGIPIVIFGDMLATGSQCITLQNITSGTKCITEQNISLEECDETDKSDGECLGLIAGVDDGMEKSDGECLGLIAGVDDGMDKREENAINNIGDMDAKIEKSTIIRLNLPASLSVSKLENKSLTGHYNLNKFKGFGCPFLYEVHKKFPHMKRYSIQRILRETRSGILEPGEALDLIWSFYDTD